MIENYEQRYIVAKAKFFVNQSTVDTIPISHPPVDKLYPRTTMELYAGPKEEEVAVLRPPLPNDGSNPFKEPYNLNQKEEDQEEDRENKENDDGRISKVSSLVSARRREEEEDKENDKDVMYVPPSSIQPNFEDVEAVLDELILFKQRTTSIVIITYKRIIIIVVVIIERVNEH